MKIRLIFFFIISLFTFIFFNSFPVNIKLVFFAPLIIYTFFSIKFLSCLWLSFIIGIIVDLYSSTFFGAHALIYTLTTFAIYNQKKYFKDEPINASIFTAIYSFAFTISNILIFLILGHTIKFSFFSIVSDIFLMPIIDGIYGFIFFFFPSHLITTFKNKISKTRDE